MTPVSLNVGMSPVLVLLFFSILDKTRVMHHVTAGRQMGAILDVQRLQVGAKIGKNFALVQVWLEQGSKSLVCIVKFYKNTNLFMTLVM